MEFYKTLQNSKIGIVYFLTVAILLFACEKEPQTLIPDANNLTSEQQKFKELLGNTTKSTFISVGNEPFILKNFIRLETKLVNAKGLEYEITPYFQTKSILELLIKTQELNPNLERYAISFSLVKKTDTKEEVLHTTVFVGNKKDQTSNWPYIEVLPTEFSLDEFKKYYSSISVENSYTLTKSDEILCRIFIGGGGKVISSFNFIFNPLSEIK